MKKDMYARQGEKLPLIKLSLNFNSWDSMKIPCGYLGNKTDWEQLVPHFFHAWPHLRILPSLSLQNFLPKHRHDHGIPHEHRFPLFRILQWQPIICKLKPKGVTGFQNFLVYGPHSPFWHILCPMHQLHQSICHSRKTPLHVYAPIQGSVSFFNNGPRSKYGKLFRSHSFCQNYSILLWCIGNQPSIIHEE